MVIEEVSLGLDSIDNIPVVFVHYGDAEYLKYTLAQAKTSNPASIVYLIGDTTNDNYEFIEHHFIDDYTSEAQKFSALYKHNSPNPYEYELFCFQRWFVLKEFITKNNVKKCLYLDSDVMLYADLAKEHANFRNYDFTLSYRAVAHCNYINTLDTLNNFCRFVLDCYQDKAIFQRIHDKVQALNKRGYLGGISDMILFNEFVATCPDKIGEISTITGNSTYDGNINFSDGFEVEKGIKNIFWINKQPYGKHIQSDSLIRFNILHFQGSAKNSIKEYFTGEIFYSEVIKKWVIKYPASETI